MRSRVEGGSAEHPVAEIIVVGNELLSGERRDRNGGMLARFLKSLGFLVRGIRVVGDSETEIRQALCAARSRLRRKDENAPPDLVIFTGGLGSTRDDRTARVIGRAMNAPLRLDPDVKRRLQIKLSARRRSYSRRLAVFARMPLGARPLLNPVGLAEGILIGNEPAIIALPGVPHELESMLTVSVEPALREFFPRLSSRASHVIGVAGMGEGELEDLFLDRKEFQRGEVSILPSQGIVYLVTSSSAMKRLILRRLGERVFTESGETPEAALVNRLLERGLTVAVAESCTGGLLSELITSVAGASCVFTGSMTVYDNSVKEKWLHVPRSILERHGAVSEEAARAMALGIRRAARSDCAVSITGIAGPDGGTRLKPVGAVYIGICLAGSLLRHPWRSQHSRPSSEGLHQAPLSGAPYGGVGRRKKDEVRVSSCLFTGDRGQIRLRAAREAIDLLRCRISIPRRTKRGSARDTR